MHHYSFNDVFRQVLKISTFEEHTLVLNPSNRRPVGVPLPLIWSIRGVGIRVSRGLTWRNSSRTDTCDKHSFLLRFLLGSLSFGRDTDLRSLRPLSVVTCKVRPFCGPYKFLGLEIRVKTVGSVGHVSVFVHVPVFGVGTLKTIQLMCVDGLRPLQNHSISFRRRLTHSVVHGLPSIHLWRPIRLYNNRYTERKHKHLTFFVCVEGQKCLTKTFCFWKRRNQRSEYPNEESRFKLPQPLYNTPKSTQVYTRQQPPWQ